MAMAAESLCHNDPNFAVICNFWDRYGEMIGLKEISYSDLERWLEDTKQVPMPLIDIHVRLLRRIGKTSVTANRWERYIIKFCYTYSDVDAWEIEKFGYKHSKLPTKLKLLKNLLEKQFDQNSTFKEKINKLAPEDMRFQPIGRDKNGLAYWYMLDNECNLRVYREDLDDNDAETWEIVCKTRSDLAELIGQLEKQIEGGREVKEEPLTSSSNSVKSEPADDDEKKLGTSNDSRDSLPDVKKDPEKIKSNEDKLDEVDGVVVIDSKEGDEKKDVKVEKNESDEKKDVIIEKCQNDGNKDIKIEKYGDDEKKENKFEKCDSDKKKDSKDGKCKNDAKKDVKVENIKSEIKNDVKKEDNHGKEKKDDDAVATSELTVKNLKTKPVDDKKSDVKSEIKNSAAECEKEGAKSNVLPENIYKSEEDSQKENVKKDSCTKISKMSVSNDKSKETTQSHCNKDTTESIPKTDTSVEDKDKIPEKNLDSQNDKSDNIIKTECLEKDEASESTKNEIILKFDDNCLKNKSDSSTKSDVSDNKDTKNREEIITNSDNKSATSNLNGAKCDTIDKKLRSSDLTEEDVKCGCDNEGETNTKGDNQGNLKNNSVVVKEIDDNKSENNVRRSSRARTARTQSQDSQLKEGKCEKETQKTCSVENNQHSEKDSDKQTSLNGDMEKENNKTPSKNKSKDKGKKRPLLYEDNSTEDSPTVEPESKKSKQARKILTKKSPVKVKSSEDTDDSDDIPLSQIKGTPKSSGKKTPNRTPKCTPKGKKGKNSKPTPTRKSSRPVKKKKFDSDEEEAETLSKSKKAKGKMESNTKVKSAQSDEEETPLKSSKILAEEVIEEEDNGGRRRSSRVKILKAKKKESTPPPSSFSEEEEGEDDGDHSEFSIETDLDDSDDEYNPTPKGRNAQRQAAIQDVQEKTVEIPNDTPCLHCHQTDRPEWLLLCDKCDDGYHTACLRPPLMIIPDGDWFCPPCEHKGLLERLQSSLKDLDIIMKKKDRLIKRKERLAFVGISLDNILKDEHKENVNPADYDQCSGEDYEEEYYKPKSKKGFVKRSCRSRNVISYKFDEFDDMINTAIKEDLENPQPYNPGKGRSRGKDMANIYMAEGREYVSEDEGKPSPVGGGKKKKGRRLTNLDSDDPADEDSGDEYKCSDDTISEPPEEEEEDEDISDYSADGERWRPKGTRRSARRNKTSRRYRDFVVDEDEDSDFAPRRKSARATRASTRQRRKYKDVWSDEEEEDLEEETEQSVDTEDLCSEDSGPTKKKKNRREIDKKVLGRKKKDKKKDEHSAKRRRIVDSEEGSESSEKSSGNGEESESKSESDDSSVDMGKIKKAAKRKLSKRRYSESSSESEKTDSEPSRHTRRSAAKKINYKAIAGTDSEATEVSEDKSESEEDMKSQKKNVIRDDSTDTDDYYDKKEDNKEGDTTEEDEEQQTKPNKQKKKEEKDEKESDTEPSDGRESPVKEVNENIPLVLKDDDSNKPQDIDSESKTEEGDRDVDLSSQDSVNSRENHGQSLTSQSQSENAAQNLSMLQNSTGVIRPCPQYSKGQNIPEGNLPPQYGSQQFQGRSPPYGSPPYGSPPHRQYMSSPPHQSYHSKAGHVMRPGQPHSQPYPPSQQYPPQAMHGNFPVSSSGQPMTPMSSSQGPVSSPPYSTMQQRPQYSSGGPIPQGQGQMFGRSVQGQPVIRGPPPGQQDESQMQQGQRPEMSGPPGGPLPHQQDGQMMRGPFPNQPQLMHGPYQNQQQMMMVQGQYSNYQQGQLMRGPHPGQQGGQMMRGPYPNPTPQDIPRGPHPNQDGTMKGQHPGQQGSSIRSPDPASSHTGHSERPMMQAPYPGYPPRHMIRGPYPGQSERNMFRGPVQGQLERPMMRGQDGPFRPGFPTPGQVIQGPHPNQQEFTNRPPHPVSQMTHSHPQMSGLQVTSPKMSSPPMSSPPMSSPPIIPSAAKDQIHSDQEKNVIPVKKENIEAKVQGENQKDSSVIKDLSTLQKHQTENEPVSKQDKDSSIKPEDKKTDIKSILCESDNKMASIDNGASDDVSKETTKKEDKDGSNEKDDEKKINEEDKQSSVSSEPENSDKKSDLGKKPDGETVAELLSQKDETKQSLENKGEKMTSNEKEILSESQFTHQRVPNLQSPPPQNQSEGQIGRGPVSSLQESSMVRGPHPYHQGMFRGQFNEMMSQMGQPRMQFQQGSMGMSNIPNMQGPQNFNQMGPGPRNFMPGMRPEPMGPMQPNFQRPMYGPGSIPYSQPQRMPNSYGPRPEMGLRMPQSYGPEDNRPEVQNKSKMAEGGPPQSGPEQTKTKKPRKPRQTKQQKLQAESKTAVSSSTNYPGVAQPPHQMTSNPQYQMPMPRPMNPQQGPYVRPPFDNYGMNGMNQGPPEYNQMNPGMYGPPQMMAGNRAFTIDNLLDKQPRVQQLEPIISQDDEDEAEPERPTSFEEETSPSNGEKDMDEMSDIGDIVKYVMNH